MIKFCLIIQLFSISLWLYPGTQAVSRIENGTLSFEQPSLVIGLVFNTTVGATNISTSNLSLSNSTNFDSVCTVLNVNATLNTSVVSAEHSLVLSVSDSNNIRRALGDNIPNCFVSSLTTYLRVPPDFVPDFSAQTVYSLVPIPNMFPPSFTSVVVNLRTGVISLEFSEITLPTTFNLSLLSLSSQPSPNPPSSVPLSDLVDITSVVGATDSYNFILEVSQLSFVDQFCPSSTCFLHLAVGSIIQDVFGNIFQTFSEEVQSTIFTQYSSSFFSATFTSTSISLTLSNMTIQPPMERSSDVTGFLVYIFLLQVDYYDESCDFPIAYEFQRRVGSTAFNSSMNPISSLPPCLNSTEYSCYSTQELSVVVDISPGFTFRRVLVTQYPGTNFSDSATDSSADVYDDILGFQVEVENLGRRRKRGVSPSAEGNRVIVSWQVDPSFCDTHQLTLYYGTRSSNLFAYVNLDRNTTCVEQFALIYTTRDRTFIIPHIRITPYATQNLVPPNSCIDLRLGLLSVHVPFFSFATDRPVISRISEIGGSNEVDIQWIEFSKPGFSIDFYNIFIFPIYALEYNGASCSNVDFQTTIEDFTFSTTEYYRHGVSPPQEDFNFACPPPPGLALPYSCYSVPGQEEEVVFTNTYTYAQGIVVEAVTREQSTNLVERIRSYPFNYTTYTLDLGRSGTNYQQYTWDSGFCHTFNSFIFTHSTFIHNQLNQFFYNSSVYPCDDGMGIDLRLIDDQNYVVSSNYITDVVTTSGTVCLLGYESLPRAFTVFLTEQSIDVVEFRYINYGTILTTIQVNEGYFNPVNIYTIPFQVSSLSSGSMGDLCPTVSSNIPSYSVDCLTNFTISSMSNLVCANTNDYFCTSVSNTINITLSVFPGFEPIIRAATGGNEFSEMPNVEQMPFLLLFSTELRQLHAQEYTSRDLETANSVRLQWNTDFYCAPDSYISFSATIQGGLVIPMRRRRWQMPITDPVATIPCSTGSYVYADLNFDTNYAIMGDVFFNSTIGFFPACPVVRIPFSSIRTLPLLNQIRILDFSSIQVSWNAISNATSYTLLAVPTQFTEFNQSIGDTFTPNTHPQTVQNLNIPNLTLFFEMCLNSNPNITCSKASTSGLSAVISIIPGFSYLLGLVFNANNEIVSIPLEQYNPNTLISDQISVSGFNNFYSYSFNESICSPSARVVFYYAESNAMSFPVNPCNISQSRIDLTGVFDQQPQPQILLIFPFTNFAFPDFNLTSPLPISVGVFISRQLTFAPISASPMITSVTQPADISSSIYQATWTPSPPLPLQQEFESYVLYALPYSNSFVYTDGACPTNVQFGRGGLISILQPATRDPLIDICLSLNGEILYFCGEFSLLSAQLSALTLLNYDFEVEASYSGGLRISNYTFSVAAAQDMSSLAISYQVTPVTITIVWNSQVSFCSDSQLHFTVHISNFQEGDETTILPFGEAAACSAGTVTLQSLLPLTTYFVEYILLFDVSGIQQGAERCVQTEIPLSLSPSPTTTSFCTPTNPCGFGLCSEGFSNSSYHCDCSSGFSFDGVTCVDIDECSIAPPVCQNAACLNTIGNFTCTCYEGYEMVVGTCEDINECEIASNCINGNCTNLLPPIGFECTCDSGFAGASCSIPVETPSCPSITEVNSLGDPVTFPVTELGTEAVVSCSLINIELFGNVTRGCGEEGEWGPVDYTDCQRIIFLSIQATNTMSETQVLTPMESEILSDTLVMATNTSNGPLFPGEVIVASQAVNVITQSLTNLSQDANALRESLANVQDNVVEATSNILSEENSPAFESVSESEAEMQIISLVEAIEDIGILIGSVAQENQTIVVEISRPAAALIVTLVNDATEPLVLGSNLSMTAGPGASALIAARTSVSIPPSVFQSSSESIAVSLSLFPTVQTLLMNIRVNSTEPNAPDTTAASNALGSSLASINLFTSSGVRITQLPDPINLTFALLNDTPIVNNATLISDLFCVSSQILSQGFNFDYVTLSNPNDVPPGPAICTATHLTHFGVLVSVTTQNLSQAEITALEVLTYITCTASIIFLLLSIAAYLFLWFKTRNKQENLFQKDATILHMNFAIALLLALIFFLSSTRGYGHRGWCTAILIIQYYFWLLVFTSSLSIGIYLLIKIFVWSSQRRVWYYLVLLAWTLPLPLIIIVPSITREYIINDAEMVCWFSKEPNFANLSFIIPMIVITLTNLIILIITAVVLFRVSKGNRGMVVQMRGILIASFTLSPILGIPWLFSIAASTPTSAVSFIFTIVLGLQGVLFAILYPLRTPEILEYFFRCKSKNALPTAKSSTSGASHPRSTPTAIKFRVTRHNATNTATEIERSKHDSLKKDIPLDEIRSVPSEGASTDFVSEPANPSDNIYTVMSTPSKNESEAHF